MKREISLKKRSAFAYVYKKGERFSAEDLVLYRAKSREGLKIGFSVSKKVGNSVTRNRVKRLLREAILPLEKNISTSYLYVIVANPTITGLSYLEVCEKVKEAFSKAGVLND